MITARLVTWTSLATSQQNVCVKLVQDYCVRPFTMLERIGKMAYCLDLAASKCQALCKLHDVFHVGILRCYQSNGLDYEAPPLEIDGEEHF